MLKVGQVVSWQSQGRGRWKPKKGIVRAVIEPGEKASQVYPELSLTPRSRLKFQLVSDVRRVLVEIPKDGRGCRHYSEFYAPLLSVVKSQN